MFNIVLFQPEIPPNTGNIIRLSANTGARLHLVKPLGFSVSESAVRRAGMDYSELTDVAIHEDWSVCKAALGECRIFALTTKGHHRYDMPSFHSGDAFLFGPESRGLPLEVLTEIPPERWLRLPMAAGNRSLNLSNTVAVTIYEAWRQQDFAGGG